MPTEYIPETKTEWEWTKLLAAINITFLVVLTMLSYWATYKAGYLFGRAQNEESLKAYEMTLNKLIEDVK